MVQSKKTLSTTELSEKTVDTDWLESEISRLEEYEPYHWGNLDPLKLGKPIIYSPESGFVVEGGKDHVQ